MQIYDSCMPRITRYRTCTGHALWLTFLTWVHDELEAGTIEDMVTARELHQRFAAHITTAAPSFTVSTQTVGMFMRCFAQNTRWPVMRKTNFRPIRWTGLRWREA